MQTSNPRFQPQAKLASHPEFAKFVAGDKISPINVEISVSHVCQASCSYCWWKDTHEKMSPTSVMDFAMATRLLTDCAEMGVRAISWTGGGEPTLHPRFPELVQMASSLGLQQGLFTNSLAMPRYDASLLEWVRVSNTDKDWSIKSMAALRSKARVMGMALNYTGIDDEVHRAIEVCDIVGADYLQVRQALERRGLLTDREPPHIEHPKLFVTKYKFDDSANPHGYSKCYAHNFNVFVWHSGEVDVCSYHMKVGGDYTLGNLTKTSFKDIIAAAPRHVPVIATCQVCCRGHETNKLTNAAITAVDKHFV